MKNIIIQAGGIGSRMNQNTENKPKCLLPYMGKTILENNLHYFKDKRIIIIVDYLSDIFVSYVKNILKRNDIIFVKSNEKSTSAGIKDALEYIKDDESFAIIWSDLFIQDSIDVSFETDILIGTTSNFKCRWKFDNGKFLKESTYENGVMGIFLFKNKSILSDIDESKSLVGGNLSKFDTSKFSSNKYNNVIEIGDSKTYDELLSKTINCRFFNKIEYKDDIVVKTCVDSNYSNLIEDEINWYSFLKNKIDFIPTVMNTTPFTLSRLNGKHLYDIRCDITEKSKILSYVYENLHKLHKLDSIPTVNGDVDEIYVKKTFDRVNSISSIIPGFNNEFLKINGKLNINPFNHKHIQKFKSQLESISVPNYNIIHGDVTFSNILLVDSKCYFIDPRGYFGETKIYGDKNYDWSKLYYSVNGNYDSINSKKFNVKIHNNEISLDIKSNGYEDLSNEVIQSSGMQKNEMDILHSIIWLSLTGYVKEDIDAIYYSFFKGIELWNLTLN